jgi:hypothetical protein
VSVDGRHETLRRYQAIWNGEEDLANLDALLAPDFVGHIGSRERDLTRLKEDIAAYRSGAPSVRFTVEHQFGEGDFLATRLRAETIQDGNAIAVRGINISRWDGDRLAEEWAVWETFPSA